MTDDEIEKLAREYAEEYTRKTFPNVSGHVRERIIEGRLEHMEDFIPWLLRTHCIVSKEKVKELHSALSKDKSMLENWEEREIFSARISMLNYLFGKDLFIDNDGRT